MPSPGELLADRYRIGSRLGSGGMATVHRARDERLERDVAVKVLLPNLAGDPATAARFEREARSLAAATHPGVVAVYDVDAGDPASGREPFFVMELCPGGSLADRLAGGRRMSPDELIPILVSVADGLADLHRRGVVHRDIKPQNILFAADRAKVADFGLALNDRDGPSELTAPGTAIGTLAYLAPEVLAGERASTAADIYALGVIAFVALGGTLPRPTGSMDELVTAARTPAPRLSSVAPELGPAFDDMIGAALAPRPAYRPDALDFAGAATAALGRWTRDGGPARWATAIAAAAAISAAAPTGPRPPRGIDGEATTATVSPFGETVIIPPDSLRDDPRGARGAAARRSAPRREVRAAGWLLPIAALFAVAVVAGLVLPQLAGLLGAPSGSSARPSVGLASPAPSVVASASPSIAASPSVPSLAPDPAFAAIDAVDAAIAGARGGPDGLKGKEANDLQSMAAAVRRALTSGDRAAALDLARRLDRRIADLGDKIGRDQTARLRAASADLVKALGG